MLHYARQAQTANRLAPRQTRSARGTAAVRGKYSPSARFWLHPDGAQVATGTAISAVRDWSGRNVSLSQGTASKQPLSAGCEGIPCFTFDGVNDAIEVATLNLSGTQAITVAVVEFRPVATGGTIWEFSQNQNFFVGGFGVFGNDSGQSFASSYSNAGASYQYKVVASAIGSWRAWVVVANRALAGVDEQKVFAQGAAINTFVTNLTADITGSWGNYASWVGSRNNGTSYAMNGSVAQVLLLDRALSTSEASALSLEIAQAAGVA